VPPPPTRHPAAGQGSLEYVGLLSVVAAVLAVAGPAAGVSRVGPEVVRVVRTGVCIVAGDVCRSSDAAAAGLAPCTLYDRRRGGGAALTVMSIRMGERHDWTVARRSDGSVLVTREDGDEAGVSSGLGFEAGPLRLGLDGTLAFTVSEGTAWELPDAATAARFLSEVEHRGAAFDFRRWPPAWRSGDAGLAATGWAGLGAQLGAEDGFFGTIAGVEAASAGAAGARIGRGATTLYLRTESRGPQFEDAFGHTAGPRESGPVIAEYTRDRGGPRELAFRAAAPGARPDELVETVARLDLRDAANRAVAARLRRRAPWPPSVLEDLRAVIRHTVAVGTVERSVYSVSDDSADLELAGRLGLELGLEVERTKVDRRLVSATAWTGGSRARAREDCLG
jgi:hypothetical protein